MAELNTIARPYAKAVFQVAQEDGAIDAWQDVLEVLTHVVTHSDVSNLLTNPKVSTQEKAKFLLGFVEGTALSDKLSNFVNVLLENHRVQLLPQISSIFVELKSEIEKSCEAEMIVAVRASAGIKKAVSEALEKRLNCKVSLQTKVNKNILGGAIIRVGDFVIDGSVSTQLQRLETALTN